MEAKRRPRPILPTTHPTIDAPHPRPVPTGGEGWEIKLTIRLERRSVRSARS